MNKTLAFYLGLSFCVLWAGRYEARAEPPPVKRPTAKEAKEGARDFMDALTTDGDKALRARIALPFFVNSTRSLEESRKWRQGGCLRLKEARTEKEWPKLASCLKNAGWETTVPADAGDEKDDLYLVYYADLKAARKASYKLKTAEAKRFNALEPTHVFVGIYTGGRIAYSYLLAIRYAREGSAETVVSAVLSDYADEGP